MAPYNSPDRSRQCIRNGEAYSIKNIWNRKKLSMVPLPNAHIGALVIGGRQDALLIIISTARFPAGFSPVDARKPLRAPQCISQFSRFYVPFISRRMFGEINHLSNTAHQLLIPHRALLSEYVTEKNSEYKSNRRIFPRELFWSEPAEPSNCFQGWIGNCFANLS